MYYTEHTPILHTIYTFMIIRSYHENTGYSWSFAIFRADAEPEEYLR